MTRLVLLALGPDSTRPEWAPAAATLRTLRAWGDIRTARQMADDFLVSAAPGDVVLCLGDRVREALRLPRVLVHPVARRGVTFRCLPGLRTRKFYRDPTTQAILEELMRCLTERTSTATPSSRSPSSSP